MARHELVARNSCGANVVHGAESGLGLRVAHGKMREVFSHRHRPGFCVLSGKSKKRIPEGLGSIDDLVAIIVEDVEVGRWNVIIIINIGIRNSIFFDRFRGFTKR